MRRKEKHGGWVIYLTLLMTLLIGLLPIPEKWQMLRPELAVLAFIYWTMATPDRVGIGTGFVLGLCLDVVTGTLLGLHAIGFSVLAFVVAVSHQRLRAVTRLQQTGVIFLLVILYLLLTLWLLNITGQQVTGWRYWLPAATSAVLWPLAFIVLRNLRRYFRVA